jgi:hypothetical protein
MPPKQNTFSPTRRFVWLGLLAVPACAPLPATSPLSREERRGLRLSEIVVDTDAATFLSTGAQERRNELPLDLRGVLRREFANRLGSGGWTLRAEIQRFNLAGSASTAFGQDQSELSGVLRLVDTQGRLRASIPVTVTAGVAGESLLGSAARAATASQGRFYRTLLVRFAEDARALLLG